MAYKVGDEFYTLNYWCKDNDEYEEVVGNVEVSAIEKILTCSDGMITYYLSNGLTFNKGADLIADGIYVDKEIAEKVLIERMLYLIDRRIEDMKYRIKSLKNLKEQKRVLTAQRDVNIKKRKGGKVKNGRVS